MKTGMAETVSMEGKQIATERDEKFRKAVGLALSELRRKRGISQEELARRAGLDRSFMSGMECGTANPTLETLKSICPHLRVTMKKFVGTVERYYYAK